MKRIKNKCPLNPPESTASCPLKPNTAARSDTRKPGVFVVRTERRSWFTLALTGFGAVLLRYLKTVRERAWQQKSASGRAQKRA